ncbi:MAG: response regulator, partial [Thermodesulfobacteriota bacterium]
MISFSIYIVDDEEIIREGLTMALEENYNIKSFLNAESALKALQTELPDLVLLDIGLPGMSGIDAIKKIKKLYPEILIIMISAYEDIDTVISAMKLGAYD